MAVYRWSMVACAAALLAACATLDVSSDYDPATDFAKYKTYQWLPGTSKIAGRDERYDDLLDQRVRDAVGKELTAKGYQLRADGAPDFLVTYQAAVQDKIDVRVINDYYGGYGYAGYYGYRGGWMVPRTETYQYSQGTLVIDIIDAAARRVIWHGTVQAEVNLQQDPQKRIARLNEAVHKVLEQFPPPKKKP
jgi:hypothetical protein